MRISAHSAPGARMLRLGSWPLVGAVLLGPLLATAGPVNVYYFKDAKADSSSPSSSGSTTPDIFFATPVAGLNQNSYTQAAETMTAIESQIAGSGSSSTTYQASINAGRLRASSASTTAGTYGGPIGTGLSTSAEQAMRIRDTLRASNGSAGSVISMTLTLQLDSLLSFFNVPTGANAANCGFGSISLFADVGNTRINSLYHDLCAGTDSMSVNTTFDVIDGQDFDLTFGMGIFTKTVMGAGNRTGSGVSIDALNTGLAFLSGPSNYRLTSTSGYSYVAGGGGGGGGGVPEPATLALVALALLTLPASHRLRGNAG